MRNKFSILFFSCWLFLFCTGCFLMLGDRTPKTLFGVSERPWEDSLTVERNSLIGKIEKHNRVEGEHYGFTGGLSYAYQWMDSLQKISSNSELIKLMQNKNPVVRAYVFWGLAIHHYDSIEKIIDEHLCDSATFEYQSGCIVSRQHLNYFCVDLLDSTFSPDQKCMKLSGMDAANLRKRMRKECGIY